WQVVAVCGRNEKVRRRLEAQGFPTPTLVLGFVDYMPELMRACDVIVSKAGPRALAEALTTALPLVSSGSLPGKDSPNVDYVFRSGVGKFSPKDDDPLKQI